VAFSPTDQVATVTFRIYAERIEPGEFTVLTLSSINASRQVEITDLSPSSPTVRLRAEREDGCICIFATAMDELDSVYIEFDLALWDAIAPTRGIDPYLYTDLDLHIQIEISNNPVLLVMETPRQSRARSTQGNFDIAYPSSLCGEFRRTRIYYGGPTVRLNYRLGSDRDLYRPWLVLGRSAVSGGLVVAILAVSEAVEAQERFVALLAAFVIVAGSLWDFMREAVDFALYDSWRKRLKLWVLLGQILLLMSLLGAAWAIATGLHGRFAAWLASAVFLALTMGALTGVGLHYMGWWHAFRCDEEHCANVLRPRRNRPECYYTGRVYCDAHIAALCQRCIHGEDLINSTLRTRDLYGFAAKPCLGDGESP
jgi:hypothetical protein